MMRACRLLRSEGAMSDSVSVDQMGKDGFSVRVRLVRLFGCRGSVIL